MSITTDSAVINTLPPVYVSIFTTRAAKTTPPPGKVLSVAPVGGYYGMFRRLYILHTLSLVECFAV